MDGAVSQERRLLLSVWLGSNPVLVGDCDRRCLDTALLILYLTSHGYMVDAGMESSTL